MVGTHEGLSTTAQKALSYYHLKIKQQLTEEDNGRYVVIDAHTGEWIIGDSVEAVFDMRDHDPGSHPVVIQHPNISTMRLSSRQ